METSQKRGVLALVYELATSRLGVTGVVLAGVYWGYTHANVISKVEYNTTRRNIPVAQGYFTDPAGLSVETQVNNAGAQEVYLMHRESNTRVSVLKDLLPDNQTVFEKMLKRARSMPAAERTSLVQQSHDLESELLKR